ncbi:MAG TPA: glycoside hydrolase family 16 protein [Acetobacteraceae bacterium]|nr:glycoside hydrolase family 16 protein [Acetobacteraceae bacterium]
MTGMRPWSTRGMWPSFHDDFETFSWNNPGRTINNPDIPDTGTWSDHMHWGDGTRHSAATTGEVSIALPPTHPNRPLVIGEPSILHIRGTRLASPIDGQTWATGSITTYRTFEQWYGAFEARIQTPDARGAWPAFWMLPSNNLWPPEVDILEGGGSRYPTSYQLGMHHSEPWRTPLRTEHDQQHRIFPAGITNIHADFHLWGFYFDESICTWYFDRQPVFQMPTPPRMRWSSHFLILGLAIGSTLGEDWVPMPDETTPDPMILKVDYVRAWSW